MDFKNVQRRVYDALNVLSAMDIIRKDKNMIVYNSENDHIPKSLLNEIETPLSSKQSHRKEKMARKSKDELLLRKQQILKRLSEK